MGNTCMPPELAHRLSINNGVEVELPEVPSSDRPFDDGDVLTLLEQITASVPWQLLKVLDLEGCKSLENKHLKVIYKILLLRYLSLRDTDVTELPQQIEKLQCLETLDIRQTRIQTLSTKPIKLPIMLKYFLAGQRGPSSNSFRESQSNFSKSKLNNQFTTVSLPRGIRRMKQLQVLSYVEISDNKDDLKDVGKLPQLRKLGVILNCKEGRLSVLFQQIGKFHDRLRSLSIRIKQPSSGGEAPDTGPQDTSMETPLQHLQSLKISGIIVKLPEWVAKLHQLEEISLSETKLEEDAINILGKLKMLRCLQLLQDSYTQPELNFKAGEFQQLRTIVWSSTTMEAISGLNHLTNLKKLELHGNCNLDPVNAAIAAHPNKPVLKHTPCHQHQEDTTAPAGASSSSSAPRVLNCLNQLEACFGIP